MQNGTIVADLNDKVELYQVKTDAFLITDENGYIQQFIDEKTEQYTEQPYDARVTYIHTYDDKFIIATEQNVYLYENESLQDPMSQLQQLDPLTQKIILTLTDNINITYITNYNDYLLLGYSNGAVKQLNIDSKEETVVDQLESAIVNIQNYKNQILLINDISGQYRIISLIDNNKILCKGKGSTHARGYQTYQKLAPTSLLVNDYHIYSNGKQVVGQLPDRPDEPLFTSPIANCQMIKHVQDQTILLVTNSQFILASIGVDLSVIERINFDGELYVPLNVETYINSNQQVVITCLYNDSNEYNMRAVQLTFKDPIQVRQDGFLDTRYTTEQLIREVNNIAANKKNMESSEDTDVQKKRDMKNDRNKVHYISDSDDESESSEEHYKQKRIDREESDDEQNEKLNNILKMLEEMRHQQPRVSEKSVIHTIQPIQLSSNQNRNTAKRLMRICRHGHATLSKGQNYSLAFHFVDDQYTDKILHSKDEIIACDIQEDAICYVSTTQLHVQQKVNQGKNWYASFSQVQKPALVSLGDSDYCAVAFETGVVLIYVNGVVTQQLYYANLLGMSAYKQMLLLITTDSFQMLDMSLMKVVYRNGFSAVGELLFCELISEGLCIAQDLRFIYMMNYQGGLETENAQFVAVHSCSEESTREATRVHEIIRRVLKPQGGSSSSAPRQTLLRSDVERLVPSFSQVAYVDVDETGAPLVYVFRVPQRAGRLTQAYDHLNTLLRGRASPESKSINDLENLFARDLAAIQNHFPDVPRIEIPVIGVPDLHECHLSPPINLDAPGIELDSLERNLFLQGIVLNAQLTFHMGDVKRLQIAQMRYDTHVLQYARECLIRGDEGRLLTAVRLFRSQKILQEFYGLVVNTNNHHLTEKVMAILQDNFDDDQQFQADVTVAQSNLALLMSGAQNGLYSLRQEELCNTYGKTDNPGMINQAKAQFRAELNDQITILEAKLTENISKSGKSRQLTTPMAASTVSHGQSLSITRKQEEENLPAPSPTGNRDFLKMLKRGAQSGQTAAPIEEKPSQKQALRVSSSTTSPKKSGLNLGSVISK